MDAIIRGLRANAVDLNIVINMLGPGRKTKNFDTLLVGFDHSHGDIAVLIIGRKEAGENIQVINQFQGKEAEELYKKLVEKEASDDDRS